MCVFTLERNGGGARAPGLIADLPECFTINGVGYLGAESLYVKFIYAASDFVIRRESDRQRAVFDLRILTQRIDHGHDLRNSCFVVRSEKRRAVGGNNVVSNQIFENRIFRHGNYLGRIFRQDYVTALVILMNDRIYVFSGNRW